jgi:prepilin-type processing-associated H-X9-DG protein
MKRHLSILFVTVISSGLVLNGCNKGGVHASGTGPSTNVTISTAEEEEETQLELGTFRQVNTYITAASMEMLKAVMTQKKTQVNADPPDLGGFELGWPDSPFCNTHITTDTLAGGQKITIAYDNNDCSGKLYLKGNVVIQVPANKDYAGVPIAIDIQHVKVTRLSDGHIAFVDGHVNVINAFGGSLKDSSNYPHFWFNQYVQSDDMSIAYPATNTATAWHLDMQRSYAGYYNYLSLTTQGHKLKGNEPVATIAAWGKDRYGRAFTWTIPAANVVQVNQCDWKFQNGQLVKTFDSLGVRIDINLGVRQDGTYPGPPCSQPIYWTYKYTSGDTTFQHTMPEPSF